MIGRSVMVKTLLVLVLCTPFGWFAWNEGRRLYETSRMPGQTLTPDLANDPAPRCGTCTAQEVCRGDRRAV